MKGHTYAITFKFIISYIIYNLVSPKRIRAHNCSSFIILCSQAQRERERKKGHDTFAYIIKH